MIVRCQPQPLIDHLVEDEPAGAPDAVEALGLGRHLHRHQGATGRELLLQFRYLGVRLITGRHRDHQGSTQWRGAALLDTVRILATGKGGIGQQCPQALTPLPFEQDELPGGQGAVIRRPQPGLEDIVEYLAARGGLGQTTTGVAIE